MSGNSNYSDPAGQPDKISVQRTDPLGRTLATQGAKADGVCHSITTRSDKSPVKWDCVPLPRNMKIASNGSCPTVIKSACFTKGP